MNQADFFSMKATIGISYTSL